MALAAADAECRKRGAARDWLRAYHAALAAGVDGGLRGLVAPRCELRLPGGLAAQGADEATRLLVRWWSSFGHAPSIEVDVLATHPWLVADLVVTRRSTIPFVGSVLLLGCLDDSHRATCLRYFFEPGRPRAHGGLL